MRHTDFGGLEVKRGAEGAANEQSEENKEHTEAKGSLIRSGAHIAKAVDKAN